ncbi:MAG: hypothetical protein M1536_00360 [Firmicutes bacterium]|nr:hypothetical protein [Bacillota bacterium]
MLKLTGLVLATALLLCVGVNRAFATPSSTVWTPCTIDIQPAGVTHLGIDNYTQVGGTESFATDVGPEWGVNISKKLSAEFGFDVLTNTESPLYFNAKIGYREDVMSKGSPALELGFFNFGTRKGVTDQNIIYLQTGKSLPGGKARIHACYYAGNSNTLKSSNGDIQNTGFMAAFDYQLVPGKWVFAADYCSGRNAVGGTGAGLYYYFTKDISLLAGPVWFNDEGINGKMKWTTQIDINF